MLGFQGALGIVQYALHLPAGLVWLHVASATLTWMTVLWTVATAGRLVPRRVSERGREPALSSAG
jgi:heme a synthase